MSLDINITFLVEVYLINLKWVSMWLSSHSSGITMQLSGMRFTTELIACRAGLLLRALYAKSEKSPIPFFLLYALVRSLMCLHCQEVKRKKDKTQRWPFFEDGNSTCESQAPSIPRVGMGRPTTSRSLRPRPSQLGDLVELLPHPQPKKKEPWSRTLSSGSSK